MFSTITGNFCCVRCKAETETLFQTHLFDTTTSEAYDCGFGYGTGDLVIIDGLDGEYSLYPYVPPADLAIVGGDWYCPHCSLGWHGVSPFFVGSILGAYRPAGIRER